MSAQKGMDLEEIKKVLPHRYPFLLVDRILEMDENSIVGIKNVTVAEPFFLGHFPQRAVMPGVLIVESMAQIGGLLVLCKMNKRGKMAYLASVHDAYFRKMVFPGDQLRIKMEILKLRSRMCLVKGEARVDGQIACNAELMFSLEE